MNRHATVGFLVLGLATILIQGNPVTNVRAADIRIGVVDMNDVLSTAPAGVRASAAFEANREAKQKALDKKKDDLMRVNAELNKQKATLDPKEFDKRRVELEQALLDLQKTYAKLERDLAQERTSLIAGLLKQAEPELQKIARNGGLSAILEKASVLWVDPALDLTEKLKAELK